LAFAKKRRVLDKPRSSPDGKLIYFTLDREASRSIHAVRLDPVNGRPVGEPFPVYDCPSPRLSMFPVNLALGIELEHLDDGFAYG
jgi:hypothetical protein